MTHVPLQSRRAAVRQNITVDTLYNHLVTYIDSSVYSIKFTSIVHVTVFVHNFVCVHVCVFVGLIGVHSNKTEHTHTDTQMHTHSHANVTI